MAGGQRFAELLDVLIEQRVDVVVVGVAAAVLQGAPLTTFDLDVVFDPEPGNRARLLALLESLDAEYVDPAGRRVRPTEERLAAHRHHLLRTRLGRLDLMAEIGDGLGWPEVLSRSHLLDVGNRRVRVLDLEAVIESKEAAGRPKDLAALPVLRETLRLVREREGS